MASIADLFIELWIEASQWPQHELETLITSGNQALLNHVESKLKRTPDESSSRGFLDTFITSYHQADVRSAKINCMLAIDRVFSAIHPRTSHGVNDLNISPWLKDYRLKRIKFHAYVENDTHRLIPNGPLKAPVHPEGSSGGFMFADHFVSLRVVPKSYTSQGRAKFVQVKVISPNKQIIKPDGDALHHAVSGQESVLCMPLADDANDLHIVINDGRVHVTPNLDAYDPAQRWLEGLSRYESIDLALGSEFAMTAESMSQLKRSLPLRAGPTPQLIVAGSFHHSSPPDQLPFNQVQVINGRGQPLWTQNKNWPAQMQSALLDDLGVSLPPDKALQYSEANLAGDDWVLADLDQLGRCLILICQDLICDESSLLIRDHQPDWIFSPISDKGVASGRWMHQKVVHLSCLSQARFVVVSGLSLAKRLMPDDLTPFVMANGPFKSGRQSTVDRAVAFLASQPDISPQHVLLRWDQTDWQQSSLTTTDPS